MKWKIITRAFWLALSLTRFAFPSLAPASEMNRGGDYSGTHPALPPISLKEQVVRIPLRVPSPSGERRLSLEATVYRPPWPGPSPLLVLSHGTSRDLVKRRERKAYAAQSRALVNLGFAVVIPMRRGYGNSEGSYAEEEGLCEQARYYEAGMQSAQDLLATVSYMAAQPYVDPKRVVLAGHSSGGFASLALASQGFPGLLGVINFGGGRGSRADKVCSPPALIAAFAKFGRTIRVPTLWLYAENDSYFPPPLVRELYRAFTEAGGRARLIMLPPFSEEGHYLFNDKQGVPLWITLVESFVRSLGVPRPPWIPGQ